MRTQSEIETSAIEKPGRMKKFSPDQLIFVLVLGALILGLTIYRYFIF
ncbi:hypothetical protein D1AOALGA4SA_1270 [Olavius algarvensis Delta 1 endosymbiont]|nr:hypothetical protein D1AOALGA4SA_1270 [Olavius algarvensis Delta 1 endosymbiont]